MTEHEMHRDDGQQKPSLRLVAETHQHPLRTESDDERRRAQRPSGPSPSLPSSSFFSAVQWTADGTAAIVDGSDQTVHAFVLPDDLLEREEEDEHTARGTRRLTPQGTTKLPEPTQITVPAPYFSLRDATTQTFLAACRDHPIQLYAVFPPDNDKEVCAARPLSTYKLIKTETEQFISPSSLLWEYPGTHFLCGSANRLDLFDVSGHTSDGPIVTVPTTPSRRHISHESGVGMKGTVSALSASRPDDASPTSVIAAGTWSRMVGLYDMYRTDKTIANWSVAHAAQEVRGRGLGGQGVVQTIWSPCGRYLVINERHATGLLVYDIRVTGQLLSILNGRATDSQQRMRCDVYQGEQGGFEVWAGDQHGRVHVWDNVGLHGDVDTQPSWGWGLHSSPVGSTALHPSGSVVATCSGGWEHRREYEDDLDSDNDSSSDGKLKQKGTGTTVLDESSLKIWSIEPSEMQYS
ncbi:WD repeat-containing protein [Geosmithia morbida]|uniref:WD repeat-containing protein n=1 Tax=Geosmithia morbida TaxID=1094350 RepID=A0A9P4Z2Z6_9HYPO|nr:WD repeat-containing protein [Geosmithia morbida]KAF4126502.1 WD repeat-containing protein [Geosmithia morbida]